MFFDESSTAKKFGCTYYSTKLPAATLSQPSSFERKRILRRYMYRVRVNYSDDTQRQRRIGRLFAIR